MNCKCGALNSVVEVDYETICKECGLVLGITFYFKYGSLIFCSCYEYATYILIFSYFSFDLRYVSFFHSDFKLTRLKPMFLSYTSGQLVCRAVQIS